MAGYEDICEDDMSESIEVGDVVIAWSTINRSMQEYVVREIVNTPLYSLERVDVPGVFMNTTEVYLSTAPLICSFDGCDSEEINGIYCKRHQQALNRLAEQVKP